jgi:hypothetical protein
VDAEANPRERAGNRPGGRAPFGRVRNERGRQTPVDTRILAPVMHLSTTLLVQLRVCRRLYHNNGGLKRSNLGAHPILYT